METPNQKHPEDEIRKVHHPEYIILEGEEEPREEKPQEEYVEFLGNLGSRKFSWALHFIFLIAACVAAVGLVIVLLAGAFYSALAVLTLFQSQEINAHFYKVWAGVRKVLVITVGLLIGIFSPPLGIGLIILYLMMHRESLNTAFVNRFFYN